MIKGWKNNPQWVTYYENKKEKNFQKRVARIKSQFEFDTLMQECFDADRAELQKRANEEFARKQRGYMPNGAELSGIAAKDSHDNG